MKYNLELVSIVLATIINLSLGAKTNYVTCGTVLKLLNTDYKTRLHSHDVKYGTGSGQQSVTAIEMQEDSNSHWQIKAPTGKLCERGEPIACGQQIRLFHMATNKNLHSHLFTSPLSGNQEISAYGDENGEGDTGDHWEVICSGDFWYRDAGIKFRHTDTSMFLAISGRSFGRPINGQMEVVGISNPNSGCEWRAMEGLFIHPKEPAMDNTIHTEL